MQKLLTIAIPTYNRSHTLEKCLDKLKTIAIEYGHLLEFIIHDNHSTDSTQDLCLDWVTFARKYSSCSYMCHSSNLGAWKNVVSLFEACNGKYFGFLGDDDFIVPENFAYILDKLRTNKYSAILSPRSYNRTAEYDLPYYNLNRFFYDYGNGFSSIVSTSYVYKVNQNPSLKEHAMSLSWPQNIYGFISIYYDKRPCLVVPFDVTRSFSGGQSITNQYYWIVSLNGLLKASYVIDSYVGFEWMSSTFISLKSKAFVSHLRAIYWNGILSGWTYSEHPLIFKSFKPFFLPKFLILSFYFFSLFPSFPTFLYLFFYTLKYHCSFKTAIANLDYHRREFKQDVENLSISKKRYQDWF